MKENKIIKKQVDKALRKFIPHGYFVFPDGEYFYKMREPFYLTKKFLSVFGIEYVLFKDVKFNKPLNIK